MGRNPVRQYVSFLVAIVAISLQIMTIPGVVRAETQPQLRSYISNESEGILHLTNKIAKKELELLRLNTRFRIATTKVSKWKRWRTFLYNAGGSACSFSGITTIAAENWSTWQRPKTASRNTLKAGPTLLLIGHAIPMGGTIIEAGLDKINDIKRHRKGFSEKRTLKRVLELKSEIDGMLGERNKLIEASSSLTGIQKELAVAEGRVLKDIRDLALVEYAQFYVRARKRHISRDVAYLNAMAITGTGGFQGSLNGILSVANRRRSMAGPAGLGFLESGALIVLAPWIKKGTAKLTGKFAKKSILKKLGDMGDTTIDNLDADRTKLRDVVMKLPSQEEPRQLAKRVAIYVGESEVFRQQEAFNAAEAKKAAREWKERVLFNAAIGGPKMAWGTQLAYAGFRYYNGAPQRFSRIIANGSTCFVVGTSVWMLDTLQSRARGEIDLYTMGVQEATPIHKLQRRIKRLEELDEGLKI